MMQLLQRHWPAIWQTISPVLCYMLATGLNNLVAHLLADTEWLNRHPRVAGLVRLSRATGLDPRLVTQGVSLLFRARLPGSLRVLTGPETPQGPDTPSP